MTSDLVLAPQGTLAPRLADHELSAAAVARIRDGVPANTRRAYSRWIGHFTKWCELHDRTPLPATAASLAEYVVALMAANAGAPSIRQAIAAIRSHHSVNGYLEQPPAAPARAALRGHVRRRAAEGYRPRQAIPIELDALARMLNTCDPDSYSGRRDRLILTLGWWGMLRRSELGALRPTDLTVTSTGHLRLLIAASKTDQEAKGATVVLPPKTDPVTDPVTVLAGYRVVLAEVERDHGPGLLLRGYRWDGIGRSMTGDAINDVVKRAAKTAGLRNAERYSAHSLRAGGATAAYRAGAPVSQIAAHGRWAAGSPVVLSYIRAVDQERHNAMRDVGQ